MSVKCVLDELNAPVNLCHYSCVYVHIFSRCCLQARLAMEAEKKRKQQQDWEAEQEKIRKKEVYLKRLEADRIAKARQHALVREQQEERQKQSLIHLEKDKQNELLERKAMFSEDIRLEQNLEKARKRIASSTANVLLKASGSNRVSSGRREKDKDTGGETENNNNNANPNNNNASNEENVERIRKAEEDAKQRVLQRKMRERQEKEKAAMEQDRIRLEQEKVTNRDRHLLCFVPMYVCCIYLYLYAY